MYTVVDRLNKRHEENKLSDSLVGFSRTAVGLLDCCETVVVGSRRVRRAQRPENIHAYMFRAEMSSISSVRIVRKHDRVFIFGLGLGLGLSC